MKVGISRQRKQVCLENVVSFLMEKLFNYDTLKKYVLKRCEGFAALNSFPFSSIVQSC